jgi:hypothetical protein
VADEGPEISDGPLARVNTEAPHSARIWNYWLGGKDNFAADRRIGDQVLEVFPQIADVARASRAFLARAVGFLVDEGVDQFLDIGTGLPTHNNTHEVAQSWLPHARVVYVDNDPMVLVHARALLTSTPQGRTAYVESDVRDPEKILHEAGRVLDFTRPVGLMMLGILGNVVDYDEALTIMRTLVDALCPGSYVVLNDGTNVVRGEERDQATQISFDAGTPYVARPPEQLAGFLHGLELVEPGLVSTPRWRPNPSEPLPKELDVFCGVARKS